MGKQNKSANTGEGMAGGHDGTRRNFLMTSALAAASPLLNTARAAAGTSAAPSVSEGKSARRPNILMVISDQYRWDFICAAGRNPMDLTPNLDAMHRRGTVFQNAMTSIPILSQAR